MKKVTLIALLGASVLLADGAELFKKCSACHGAKGEKPALGKSKVIADMNSTEITTALNGYKDGTYGGPMKGLMKGQVISLTPEQIEALSAYIASCKGTTKE